MFSSGVTITRLAATVFFCNLACFNMDTGGGLAARDFGWLK